MSFDFSQKIESGTSRAIYLQLMDIIEQQIAEKKLLPGDMLPSENEFCHSYGISRTTVRQTLHELEAQGFIERKRGIGTFIQEQKVSRRLGNLYSFSEDMKKLGLTPGSKVLSYRLVSRLECKSPVMRFDSDRLIEVQRLRIADNRPLLLERTYLSVELCPNLPWETLENSSLYALLTEQYGLKPERAIETYEAVLMRKEEAQALQCEVGQPAFMLSRSTWDNAGRLIEYTVSIMPSSRSKFEIHMQHDSVRVERKPL